MSTPISASDIRRAASRLSEHKDLEYQRGFGNEFETEAITGALPRQNNPRKAPLGLYSELITTTSFIAPRPHNRHTYVFRLRPSVTNGRFLRRENGLLKTAPLGLRAIPTQMRWNAFEIPTKPQDFVDGIATLCGNGDAHLQVGIAIHIYLANQSMKDRVFATNDGELLIIPQLGGLRIFTELGVLAVEPGEFALIPRGCRFRVDLQTDKARGYICENYGVPMRLPDMGTLGSMGLANPVDFKAPVAAFEDKEGSVQLIQKYSGDLWVCELNHSPLDVVAWRGSGTPFKYSMNDFLAIGALTRDHPDPSIFTALTSPSDPVLGSNVDLLLLPPRWLVGDNTFRPAPFHRNVATEFSGFIYGAHESKSSGTQPGGAVLHNGNSPHGPDVPIFERASTGSDSGPQKVDGSLMFALETRFRLQTTEFAMSASEFQQDYPDCWIGFPKLFENK